jgi:hypothetical protein
MVLAAVLGLSIYSARPAAMQPAPGLFPADSALVVQKDRPQLLTFAHPECPCTRATFYNLENMAKNYRDALDFHFVFYLPETVATDWQDAWLVRKAEAHPNIHVHFDRDGSETQRFQVATSGETLLYDSRGKLAFQGGVTVSRGHSGESRGTLAIKQFMQEHQRQKSTGVFGCSIFEEGDLSQCMQPQ